MNKFKELMNKMYGHSKLEWLDLEELNVLEDALEAY